MSDPNLWAVETKGRKTTMRLELGPRSYGADLRDSAFSITSVWPSQEWGKWALFDIYILITIAEH